MKNLIPILFVCALFTDQERSKGTVFCGFKDIKHCEERVKKISEQAEFKEDFKVLKANCQEDYKGYSDVHWLKF